MSDISQRQQQLALPLHRVPFVLLDIESTGLDARHGDRICEVALLRWQGGETIARWETLINPERPLSAGAFAVNGIEDDALLSAPTFADVADLLLAQVKDAVIVAHNVPFDVEFLDRELARLGRPSLPNITLDTLTLARSYLDQNRYNLGTLSRALGFDSPTHRAMSDVIALKALFEHLLGRLRMLGVTTLGDLVRAQRGLLPGAPEPQAPPLIAEALRNGTRLRIAYRTDGGEPVVRDILPLEYRTSREMPRLLAYCYLRNSQRTFYLDRIIELADAHDQDGAPVPASPVTSDLPPQ